MNEIIKEYLKGKGLEKSIDEEFLSHVEEWAQWYKGKNKWHKYTVYNGAQLIPQERMTLNLPYQICNDLTDYVFNEKLKVNISSKNVAKIIDECLMQNEFLQNCNELMQLVNAMGTGALVPYLDEDQLKINYICMPCIIPISWVNREIEECLFWSITKSRQGEVYRFNLHLLDDSGYTIYNDEWEVINGKINRHELPDKVAVVRTGSFVKKFGILKTPNVNNYNVSSPYGVSVYYNALDNIKSCDRIFDALDNEINLGKKRIFIQAGATKQNIDSEGNISPVFDTSDVVFHQIPDDDNSQMITESNFSLRVEELKTALQMELDLLSKKVGLGMNGLKIEKGDILTATQVISEDSDTFRRVRKQENIITTAIKGLVYGIADLIGITEQFDIKVEYDDSIIEDSAEIKRQALLDYSAGLISPAEYFRVTRGMEDKQAVEFVKKMEEEKGTSAEPLPFE